MGDDRRPDYLDREKKSFSERDRLRREGAGNAPGGPAAQERAKRETQHALAAAESLFSASGGAERERLATAMLDARGTPALAEACREFLGAAGPPAAAREISCFLDADATDVLRAGLDAAARAHAAGSLEVTRGLRSQLRMLTDHPDDEVADGAETLLEAL